MSLGLKVTIKISIKCVEAVLTTFIHFDKIMPTQ